jgi:hypothetical protein
MRMALFVRDPFDGADGQQRNFVGGIRARYTTASCTDTAQLGQRVEERLRVMAAESLTPWVALGETAFRASSTRNSGDTVMVRATSRSSRVAELIKSLPDARGEVAYAGPHESALVRVTDVSTEATSTGSQNLEITMRSTSRQQHSTPMSINGMSADDVFEKALRGALFGEPVENSFWGLATMEDPLEILWGRNLPDAVARSLAHALTNEVLRHQDIKGGSSTFTLGPPKANGRLLEISWFPPRRYANEPAPAERTLAGTVAPI